MLANLNHRLVFGVFLASLMISLIKLHMLLKHDVILKAKWIEWYVVNLTSGEVVVCFYSAVVVVYYFIIYADKHMLQLQWIHHIFIFGF